MTEIGRECSDSDVSGKEEELFQKDSSSEGPLIDTHAYDHNAPDGELLRANGAGRCALYGVIIILAGSPDAAPAAADVVNPAEARVAMKKTLHFGRFFGGLFGRFFDIAV